MKGNSPIVSQKRVFWQVEPPHECGLIGSCEKFWEEKFGPIGSCEETVGKEMMGYISLLKVKL
jgi:hypothetical protein